MGINEKFKEQLSSLNNAIADFKLAVDADLSKYESLEKNWIQNGQIQKFEFCIEILWKTIKTFFEKEGQQFLTPKQNIKEFFNHNLIGEELYLGLMNCIEDRNKLSHVYKIEYFEEVIVNIAEHYKSLHAALAVLNKNS